MNIIWKYRYWAPVIVLTLLNCYLSAISWQGIRDSIGWVKNIPQTTEFKVRHIVQFAPYAIFIFHAFFKTTKLSINTIYLYTFMIVVAQAAASEIIQIFSPTRIPSFLDVFWSSFGGVCGILLIMILRRFSSIYVR